MTASFAERADGDDPGVEAHGTAASVPRPAESAARLLHPAARPGPQLDAETLGHIAAGLADSVQGGPRTPDGDVDRRLLLATEAYDVWLVAWGAGAAGPEHDHDGSLGVLQVVEGELIETVRPFDTAAPASRRRLVRGDRSCFDPTARHSIAAGVASGAVAVAVYSPPFGRDGRGAPSGTDVSPN